MTILTPYLEPAHAHHVREYAWKVIDGFRELERNSWSAAALELNLKQRERSNDWRGFRGEVEANARHLLALRTAAAKLEWQRNHKIEQLR